MSSRPAEFLVLLEDEGEGLERLRRSVEVTQEALTDAGRAPTPDQLSEARRRLVQVRRAALVADWLAGIRARTPIQIAGAR